jgi:hypothetical protein
VGDFAKGLEEELSELGLRAKLHVVATEPGRPLPDSCMADARTARLRVLLANVSGVAFLSIMPAPRVRGDAHGYAPPGMKGEPRNYLFDLGDALKQEALDARRERDRAPDGSEERAFKSGRLLAYFEVLSTMRNRAEGFGVPLSAIRLDDFDPDRELL